MNAKENKQKLEKIVKDAVDEFHKETGLTVNYIDVTKKSATGFKVENDIEVKVKLKED